MDNLTFYDDRVKKALSNQLQIIDCNYLYILRDDYRTELDKKFDIDAVQGLLFLDNILDFYLPLNKCLMECGKRLHEDDISKSQDLSKYNTNGINYNIAELYDALTSNVSPQFSNFLIGKLDTEPWLKNELSKSIENGNYANFESTIIKYGVDYTLMSNCVADIMNADRFIDTQKDKVDKLYDGLNKDDLLESKIALELLFNSKAKFLHCVALNEDADFKKDVNDEIEQDKKRKQFLNDLFRKDSIEGKAFYARIIHEFSEICDIFRMGYKRKRLLDNEIDRISDFIRRKRADIPIVDMLFNICTRGELFTPTFELINGWSYDSFDENLVIELMHRLNDWSNSEDARKYVSMRDVAIDMPNFWELTDEMNVDIPGTKYKAKDIFQKAIDSGFITWVSETNTLHWNYDKNKNALEFLIGRIYYGDYLIEDKWCMPRGNENIKVIGQIKKLFGMNPKTRFPQQRYNNKRNKNMDGSEYKCHKIRDIEVFGMINDLFNE